MNFSEALQALKSGKKVTRAGRTGYVILQKGYPDGVPINKNTAEATGIAEGTVCRFLPYLMVKTLDGSFAPWTATQMDLLAEDWFEV